MAKRATRRHRRVRLGRLWAIGVLVIVAYLYYRPLSSWMHTRAALAQRTADVAVLERRKTALERAVAAQTSDLALERQARRIGLVRPGERLFVVNGIAAWRRVHERHR